MLIIQRLLSLQLVLVASTRQEPVNGTWKSGGDDCVLTCVPTQYLAICGRHATRAGDVSSELTDVCLALDFWWFRDGCVFGGN